MYYCLENWIERVPNVKNFVVSEAVFLVNRLSRECN
jgi:hypothetical protein